MPPAAQLIPRKPKFISRVKEGNFFVLEGNPKVTFLAFLSSFSSGRRRKFSCKVGVLALNSSAAQDWHAACKVNIKNEQKKGDYTMQRVICIIALLWALVFISQTAGHAADKIRIGTPNNVGYITLPVAQKKGFLKEEGFETEIIRFSGTVATAALNAGEINYFTGFSAPLHGAMRGLPFKVVASFMPAAPFVLVARPEFKSVQELKGKTIGISSPGTGGDLVTRMMLKHFGINPEKEAMLIRAGIGEGRLAAMQQGIIVATAVPFPLDLKAKKLGFNVLAKAHELFSYPESGLWVTVKTLKERPQEVKRVIKAGIKANRYIRSNRDETIQFLSEWLRIDRETATSSYDSLSHLFSLDGSIPEIGLRLVIEENKKLAQVNREVSFSEVADFSILKEAQKELGIKGR